MSMNLFHASSRMLVAGAALCLLAGCEAARVAQPQPAPSPAENVAAAAAELGVAPSAIAGPAAALAQRVQGWDVPAAPATGQADAKLDPATSAELARRAATLERRIRASTSEGKTAPR